MNNKQTVLIGIGVVLLIATVLIWWTITPSWRPLFSYTLPEPAQKEVLDLLNREGIQYKIDNTKNGILLKPQDIQSAHKLLAANDLPKVINSGLEMFNNSDYGLSEFAQNINYQRGMEEELARTIMRMEGIKNARVHLTIKKDSLFEDRKQEPKASVVISFKNDVYYDPNKIRGIQELLSAAIPNLLVKNVVVITDKGDVVSNTGTGEAIASNRSIEAKYEVLLMNLLDLVLGESNYKLSINIQMDYKKKITIEENYYPDSTSGAGFIVKMRSVNKSNDSSPGTRPLPDQNTLEQEFVYSKEKSEIAYPVGEIKKVTVGLVVNSNSEKLVESLEGLVYTTLGMDAERGDKLSIVVAPVNRNKDTNSWLEIQSESEGVVERKEVNEVNEAPPKYQPLPFVLIVAVISILCLLISALLLWVSKRQRSLSELEKQKMVNELLQWIK